jgi:hypothetical protein
LVCSALLLFVSLPAAAQTPINVKDLSTHVATLQTQVATLQTQVAKLAGTITAADLVGTYSALIFDTSMRGFRAGPCPSCGEPARIDTSMLRGTFTLNADGTGTGSLAECGGSRLFPSTGTMEGLNCTPGGGVGDEEPNPGLTWVYADGVVTFTFLDDGDVIPLAVAVGGKFLFTGFSPFHPSDPSSDHSVFLLARLQ